MDELIEAQISEQILAGDYRPFYDAGQGREGLYHYWLAGWLSLLGKHRFTLRMASTSLSLLSLAAAFQFTRRLFGSRIALYGLAFGVTTFWYIFSARSGLRSTMLPLLAALAGTFFWQGIPRLSRTTAAETNWPGASYALPASGFFLGLTFYAYTAARVLPVIFILFSVYLLLFHRRSLSGRLWSLAAWIVVLLLLVIPFWQFLQANPSHELAPDAQYYLADISVQENDLDEAIQAFNRIPELYPSAERVPWAVYRVGLLQVDLGNTEEAIASFERVVNTHPDSDAAELAQGKLDELR